MRMLNRWTKLAPVAALAVALGACTDQLPTEVQPMLEPGSPSLATAATSLAIYPGKYTLDVGQVKQMVAIPRDARGNTLSTAGQPVVWSSSNAAVAKVDAYGRVRALAGGTTYIKAVWGGASRRALITVRAPVKAASISIAASATQLKVGSYGQLTASVKDASGAPVSVPLTWKSSNTSAIRVYSNGLVKAVGAGSATISVSGGGATGKISISAGSVKSSPTPTSGTGTNVASVAVFPMTQTLAVGLGKQFIALPRDASGTTVSGKAPTWKSSNTSVATVSSRGLVITRGAGVVTITATVDGVVGRATVTVTR